MNQVFNQGFKKNLDSLLQKIKQKVNTIIKNQMK